MRRKEDVLVYSRVTINGLNVPFDTSVLLVLPIDTKSHLLEVDWQVVDINFVLAGFSPANEPL